MSTTSLFDGRADHSRIDRGPGIKIYVAFIPWVMFSLIARHSTLRAAAVAALVGALVIALPAIYARRTKVLEIGAILAFAGFTIVAFAADPATGDWVARYARAIAAALLAVIAFSSLLVSPFTAQYARESVPRQFWSSPRFTQINRQLTLMWALVFTALVPAHLIAGALNTGRANLLFNWALPAILVFWAAKRTSAITAADGQAA
ncbi:MAG: hypothetical protein JO286_15995 [Solirubrobacterales bacterium]|nr:hypothetical protein [Solirubrobacterales bacterium]